MSRKTTRHSAAKSKPQGKAVIRGSIGPVEDLESYVKADWWRDIFNANYLRTDGDVVEDPDITEGEIDAFLELVDVEQDACILDLCCGQGRHLLELARRGFTNLYGVDRSHYLISRARRIARQHGYTATFREGDARKLRFRDNTFDLIYLAGNSFGYFESAEDDIAVLTELRRLLKPAGQLLIDFTDGDFLREKFESRSWEWIDKNYFVCRERTLSKDNARLISREVITHTKKGVVADQFYAERLYNASQLGTLLAENGFDVLEARLMSTMSKRNQDLGMMAQRVVLTARSNKRAGDAREEERRVRQVKVVMGDHRRSDSVKPNSAFDSDDFHTINELKSALAQLDGFNFSYLDNHGELVDALREDAGKIDFVFNLCDEGFNNEASKELHVPSLLEMLDIRYSGGNPQCLAYCYDKSLIRGIAKEMDIPVPAAFSVAPEEVAFISKPIDFPVIVKPNYGDSSVGITVDSVCYDVGQLEYAIAKVREATGFDRPVLVEQFLTGKDISVGIIGNPPDSYTVLPVIEEDYSQLPEGLPRICGYEAKWDTESDYFRNIKSIPAELPQSTIDFLGASCIRLFQRVGCQDYARFDWRLDANNTPRLLEVNPNPGWCWDGHLARMAEFAGLSYADMLREILVACDERLRATGRSAARLRAA
ncbi:MAG: methyltransferase domain-containing protein [Gammaproteobacteria bacterium]|nr:methyltransferase domain-containing protein [Gammaproteobacteria bacterium]MDH3906414.1 methyltransferase domain-containing protein [Gammaproteobacteria bacterium]